MLYLSVILFFLVYFIFLSLCVASEIRGEEIIKKRKEKKDKFYYYI